MCTPLPAFTIKVEKFINLMFYIIFSSQRNWIVTKFLGLNNWYQNFLDPWSHYWTIGEWSNQGHSYSHLFPAGRYRVIPTKHDIFNLSLHRVIPTKQDIFNLSLQVDTGWFPQNMTFSIFPCRLIQGDS